MKRIFIAVKFSLNESTRIYINRIKAELSESGIKWVEPENLHLTIKFLGETEEYMLNSLNLTLAEIVKKYKPFTLEIHGLGIFVNLRNPRVLWLGIGHNKTFTGLREETEEKLEILGIKKSEKVQGNHLTLGRIKFIRDRKKLIDLLERFGDTHFQEAAISEIFCIESVLRREGPLYKVLYRYNL